MKRVEPGLTAIWIPFTALLLAILACQLPGAVTRRVAPISPTPFGLTAVVSSLPGSQGTASSSAGDTPTPPETSPSAISPVESPAVTVPVDATPPVYPGAGAPPATASITGEALPQTEAPTTEEPGFVQPASSPYPGGAPPQASLSAAPSLPAEPALAFSPTPSLEPSATLQPTPTLYATPVPPASPTPTPTRTLIPAPPWVRVPLKATDPRLVKLASGKVQLVEFFAFWSGPSQAMAPLIQGLQDGYGDEVNFVFLDIDNSATKPFQRELHFRLEPHFFLLAPDGRVLQQWSGYVTTAELQKAIEAALQP